MAKDKSKKSSKPAKVEEPDDDVELEELDDDDATDEAPSKKAGKGKGDDDTFGVRALIDLIKKKFDKDYTPRQVRTLLRSMARRGELDREIVAGNKDRWVWEGPDDPEVKKILKAVKKGEIEDAKTEQLQALKERKAAKAAEKEKAEKKAGKKKAKKAPEPDDDDDDDEDEDE